MKAVLFDLDGVIVDTAKYHYEAWNRLAQSVGFSISEEQNHLLKGVSRMESLDLILEMGGVSRSQEEKKEMAEQKNKWYTELISDLGQSEILPGIANLLHDLRLNSIHIGLGSASKNSVPILTTLGLLEFFEVVIDGNKTTKSKPDPQVFEMGAEALGIPCQSCLVIEDSSKGLDAAIEGGFRSLGIGNADELGHAEHVFADLSGVTAKQLLDLYSR